MNGKPALTGTTHPLPFDRLSPLDFERLCLALLPREGLADVRHLGAAGGEQGRDIVAWRDGGRWYVQCKRVEKCGPQVLLGEIEKIEALMAERPHLRPAGLLFMVSCDVSATAEDRAAEACKELGLACEMWARTDLDWRVQEHRDLVERFFRQQVVADKPAPFAVPFPRNERFVGREAELAELHRLLQEEKTATGITPAGISGMGGIGKTQLAVEYAYGYRDHYPGGVLWVNAARVQEWNPQLVDMADQLGLAPADANSPDRTGQMVAALARHLHEHPDTLLIFDNVFDPRHLQRVQLGAGITAVGLGGTLLFTTRRREMPEVLTTLDVRVLPRESSRQMIVEARPEAAEDPDLDRLCAALGDLPLALSLAAAALRKRTRLSLAAYLENLRRLGADEVHEKIRVSLDDYYAASLTPALQEQWKALEDDKARLVLRVAGQLGEAELIPVARLGLLAGLRDDEEGLEEPLGDALRELAGVSLVEELQADQVRLHPLVREFATRQTAEEDILAFRQWCAANLAAAYEDFGILESHCARRGVDALQKDLLVALDLVPHLPRDDYPRSSIQSLLGLLKREAHNLRGWAPGQRPAFFAQQIYYRAASLGLADLATKAATHMTKRRLPLLLQRWRAGSESPALERTLTGHERDVTAVAVTPDGRRAVSASYDRTLRVWDLDSGGELATLRGHEDFVNAVAVTPDGRRAVSASSDRTLRVWDLDSGGEIATLRGHESNVFSVAVSADGRTAVSGSSGRTLRVWDLDSGAELATLRGHEYMVRAVAVTPDGQRAVSASYDGTLKVWDISGALDTGLDSGAELATLRGRWLEVNAVVVTPDGQRAVSVTYDGTLRVWDLDSGQEMATLTGHAVWVRAVAVAVTPDGRRAVSAYDDGTLRVWDLEDSGGEMATLRGHEDMVRAVAVTPDGQRAISASHGAMLKVWDLASAVALGSRGEMATLRGHERAVRAVAVTPDGRQAVSASSDQTLRVWDLDSGEELATLYGHKESVLAVLVTPDGRRAVSGSDDGTLKVWDISGALDTSLDSGAELATLRGHESYVLAVAVTPDGRRAVSGSDDGTLKVWDLDSGGELATLRGHKDSVNAVAVTPDGQRAVSGSSVDGTLKVWDLDSGGELATLYGYAAWVRAVAVMPDGRRAVLASEDRSLRVWDLDSGAELTALRGHEDKVLALAVAPDGRRVVSASEDRTLRVWDLDSGQELATIALDGSLFSVSMAPDGATIVTGDGAGSVYCLRYVEPSGTEDA